MMCSDAGIKRSRQFIAVPRDSVDLLLTVIRACLLIIVAQVLGLTLFLRHPHRGLDGDNRHPTTQDRRE